MTEPRQERINDIVGRAQDIVQLFEKWKKNEHGGPIVPEELSDAIKLGFLVSNSGDVPASCRELVVTAIPEMHKQQMRFEAGLSGLSPNGINNDKTPKSEWFVAMQGVMTALVGAKPRIRTPMTPVCVLLDEEKASYEQIAFHMWGRRFKGPFVLPNGSPNIAKIIQQAAAERYELAGMGNKVERVKDDEGNVLDSNWIPSWDQEFDKQEEEELKKRLEAVKSIAEKPKFTESGSIADRLLDGQYCDYIAKTSAGEVSVPDVIRQARRTGIQPTFTPTYRQTPEDLQAMLLTPETAGTPPNADQAAIEQLVIENIAAGGAAEIVAKLGEGGVVVSSEQVNKILVDHRKAARKAVTK